MQSTRTFTRDQLVTLIDGYTSPDGTIQADPAGLVDELFARTAAAVEIAPGMTLPNGATVIAASAREAHEWIVLALTDGGEYVTWKCSRPGNGSDTRWGHYFTDLREAVTDFYERA